jgi:chemotaxis protein CheX
MNPTFVAPFVKATAKVFATMLRCSLTRPEICRKRTRQPYQEVSGVIELSGAADGVVVLGMSRASALRVTEVLLQESRTTVDELVRDAVGELANMIAGNAKADLEGLSLRLGLPYVLVGKHHLLPLPERACASSIHFASDWDEIVVEVGLTAPLRSAAPCFAAD